MKKHIVPLVAFLIVIALVLGPSAYLVYSGVTAEPESVNYEYNVKTDQVEQAGEVTDSVDFDNLSQAEQDVLFEAYKKSDHFLGGASVEVELDEHAETFDGWKIVRVEGVPLLVAVTGPEEVQERSIVAFTTFISGWVWFMVWLLFIGPVLFGWLDEKLQEIVT